LVTVTGNVRSSYRLPITFFGREVDYFALLKSAWRLTWRHPILWLFGLLVILAPAAGRLVARYWLHGHPWQRLRDRPERILELFEHFSQPLFLLTLATLLLGSGGLIGLVLLLAQGSGQQTIATAFLAGSACLSGLLLLALPLYGPLPIRNLYGRRPLP
jgi:hypothetical protein